MVQEVTILQIITIVIASVGAVLGIINTWFNLDRSRVKLKVLPKHAIPVGAFDPNLKFCIEITNLSLFPVSVDSAGVLYHGTGSRGLFIDPIFMEGGNWPKRLESRSSVTVYRQLPEPFRGHKIKCAYAQTQCGKLITGNSGALKQIADSYEP